MDLQTLLVVMTVTNLFTAVALTLQGVAMTKIKNQFEYISDRLRYIHSGVGNGNGKLENVSRGVAQIGLKLEEMDAEANKDAGAIKRRQNWSKKREKKDLKQESK